MRLNFRQGIVDRTTSDFLAINPGTSAVQIVNTGPNNPTTVTIAHRATDYLFSEDNATGDAWIAPGGGWDPGEVYWLYWDFNLLTFARTYGHTTLTPIVQGVDPTTGSPSITPTTGQMWYDTAQNIHYRWTGVGWAEVLRVFAAQLLNGNTFASVSANAPNFNGTQIGDTSSIFAGRVLADSTTSAPFARTDGTFLTTEDQFFANSTRVDALRLESNVARAQAATNTLAKYTVVAWKDESSPLTEGGVVDTAEYDDTGSTVLGILTQDILVGEVGGVIIQGVVTNPAWDWTASVPVGSELWVQNGSLVTQDPHLTSPTTYPQSRVPTARVLSKDTVVFEQGLGGVGPQGPQGPAGDIEPATTTTLGGGFLSVPATIANTPIIVEDNDPRLVDARTPLAHTQGADTITFTPAGNIAANTVEGALVELDNEKVAKAGDTMTGFLTLHASPTLDFHAATKIYVDQLVAAGIRWIDPILTPTLLGIDVNTPPGGSPTTAVPYFEAYILGASPSGDWSGFLPGDVVAWDGFNWVNILPGIGSPAIGRGVAVGDRFGVGLEPDTFPTPTNLDASVTADLGKIITMTDVTPGSMTWTSETPLNFDTSLVNNEDSLHFAHAYHFTGVFGVGVYGTDYKWTEVAGPGAFIGGTNIELVGNTINVSPQGVGSGLDADLWDGQQTNITLPATGEVLSYNGGNWINVLLGLNDLSDVNTPGSPPASLGEVLAWDGSAWSPTTIATSSISFPLRAPDGYIGSPGEPPYNWDSERTTGWLHPDNATVRLDIVGEETIRIVRPGGSPGPTVGSPDVLAGIGIDFHLLNDGEGDSQIRIETDAAGASAVFELITENGTWAIRNSNTTGSPVTNDLVFEWNGIEHFSVGTGGELRYIPYDIVAQTIGSAIASTTIFRMKVTQRFIIGLTGHDGFADTPPSGGTAVFNLERALAGSPVSYSTIGTFTFPDGADTPTLSNFTADTVINVGDRLRITPTASVNSIGDVTLTIKGYVA